MVVPLSFITVCRVRGQLKNKKSLGIIYEELESGTKLYAEPTPLLDTIPTPFYLRRHN
jgi:hypothetical protein